MTAQEDNERQYTVIDQLMTMHSVLRDQSSYRSNILNCSLLVAAVILNACVFIGDETFTMFGLKPSIGKFGLNIASVCIFVFSVLEIKVNWSGKATLHKEAVEKLSALKLKYRQNHAANITAPGILSELTTEYNRLVPSLPPIPDSKFNSLKQLHLRKKRLSIYISQNPGAPIVFLRIKIFWESISQLYKGNK